jgi:hypothetical protein
VKYENRIELTFIKKLWVLIGNDSRSKEFNLSTNTTYNKLEKLVLCHFKILKLVKYHFKI